MKRIKTLDVFRGLAAYSVLLVHYTQGYRERFGHSYNPKYDFYYGYLGVEFFFLISGFVIFLTVLNSTSFFDFAFKRFSRLYPTFVFCFIATFILVWIFKLPRHEITLSQFLSNLTMMPDILGFKTFEGVYWTLEIEVFFYFFMAVLILTKQLKNILLWGAVYIVLAWINKFAFTFPTRVAMLLNVHYSAFFFAGILFFHLKFNKQNFQWLIHLLIIISYFTCCLTLTQFAERTILLCFFIIFYLFSYDKLNWLHTKPLIFLGVISYPLYLIHASTGFIIMNHTREYLENYPFIFILSATIIVTFVAFLVHEYIEEPSINYLRKLKRKYFNY